MDLSIVKLVVVIFFIFLNIQISKQSYQIYVQEENNVTVFQPLELNGPCHIEKTGTYGICKFIYECPLELPNWYAQSHPPTICGSFNGVVLLCCPVEIDDRFGLDNDTMEVEFVKFHRTCMVKDSGQIGTILRKKHCPYPQQPIKSNICPYEICDDLVCCPRQHCGDYLTCEYANIEKLLQNRLHLNFECIVHGTHEIGTYSFIGHCDYYANHLENGKSYPKVCNWDFCENFVCCPNTHIRGTMCTISISPPHEYIELKSGSCTDAMTGQKGTCRAESQCLQTKTENPLTRCGQFCREDIVCCPDPIITSLAQPHQRACVNYLNEVYEDSKTIHILPDEIDNQVYIQGFAQASGGVFAFEKEFPHMSVLGYDVDGEIQWNCGGSLISDEFILTAGHCLYTRSTGPVKYARIGITNLNVNKSTCDCPTHFNVAQRIPHPHYTSAFKYNDIALIKLDRKVSFYSHIRPACLPSTPDIPFHLKAAGFGDTTSFGFKSVMLLRINLELFSAHECNETFKLNFNKHFTGLNEETQFCAGSKHSIMDTCRGDSGGPIQAKHSNYYKMATIYGVTSFGKGCGFQGSPSVYTTVYPFVPWIERIVWS